MLLLLMTALTSSNPPVSSTRTWSSRKDACHSLFVLPLVALAHIIWDVWPPAAAAPAAAAAISRQPVPYHRLPLWPWAPSWACSYQATKGSVATIASVATKATSMWRLCPRRLWWRRRLLWPCIRNLQAGFQ